jgi:predicted Rdx family selenoprotein
MKRWLLVLFVIFFPGLAILIPAEAQASPAQLTSGQPVNVVIATSGQQPQYTFAATAGHHVTFQVSQFDLLNGGSDGYADLYFYEPGSSTLYTDCGFGGNSYCDFVTPVSGTWSVTVEPYSASTGSLTLTFANDVATRSLASGKAGTTAISVQGQNAGYTFAATRGHHVTFQITKFHLLNGGSDGYADLYFYEPGSSTSYTDCGFGSNSYCDFVTPETGTWSVTLEPYSASTGSLTLTFANDVGTRSLTSGKAVTTAISIQGQNAGYTFAARRGHHVTFQITKFHLLNGGSDGYADLEFYEPGSSSVYTDCSFSSNSYCDFVTPESGKWSVTLDPYSASTGRLMLTFANDVGTRSLTPGKTVKTAIRVEGQNASYTFIAKRNWHAKFQVSKFHLLNDGSTGSAYLYFYQPGSSTYYTYCGFSSNSSCSFTTPNAGKWRAVLEPYSASVGSLQVKMTRRR